MYNPICLDDVLVAIRQQSNQTPANVRIPELNGMLELIEHLTNADYLEKGQKRGQVSYAKKGSSIILTVYPVFSRLHSCHAPSE